MGAVAAGARPASARSRGKAGGERALQRRRQRSNERARSFHEQLAEGNSCNMRDEDKDIKPTVSGKGDSLLFAGGGQSGGRSYVGPPCHCEA